MVVSPCFGVPEDPETSGCGRSPKGHRASDLLLLLGGNSNRVDVCHCGGGLLRFTPCRVCGTRCPASPARRRLFDSPVSPVSETSTGLSNPVVASESALVAAVSTSDVLEIVSPVASVAGASEQVMEPVWPGALGQPASTPPGLPPPLRVLPPYVCLEAECDGRRWFPTRVRTRSDCFTQQKIAVTNDHPPRAKSLVEVRAEPSLLISSPLRGVPIRSALSLVLCCWRLKAQADSAQHRSSVDRWKAKTLDFAARLTNKCYSSVHRASLRILFERWCATAARVSRFRLCGLQRLGVRRCFRLQVAVMRGWAQKVSASRTHRTDSKPILAAEKAGGHELVSICFTGWRRGLQDAYRVCSRRCIENSLPCVALVVPLLCRAVLQAWVLEVRRVHHSALAEIQLVTRRAANLRLFEKLVWSHVLVILNYTLAVWRLLPSLSRYETRVMSERPVATAIEALPKARRCGFTVLWDSVMFCSAQFEQWISIAFLHWRYRARVQALAGYEKWGFAHVCLMRWLDIVQHRAKAKRFQWGLHRQYLLQASGFIAWLVLLWRSATIEILRRRMAQYAVKKVLSFQQRLLFHFGEVKEKSLIVWCRQPLLKMLGVWVQFVRCMVLSRVRVSKRAGQLSRFLLRTVMLQWSRCTDKYRIWASEMEVLALRLLLKDNAHSVSARFHHSNIRLSVPLGGSPKVYKQATVIKVMSAYSRRLLLLLHILRAWYGETVLIPVSANAGERTTPVAYKRSSGLDMLYKRPDVVGAMCTDSVEFQSLLHTRFAWCSETHRRGHEAIAWERASLAVCARNALRTLGNMFHFWLKYVAAEVEALYVDRESRRSLHLKEKIASILFAWNLRSAVPLWFWAWTRVSFMARAGGISTRSAATLTVQRLSFHRWRNVTRLVAMLTSLSQRHAHRAHWRAQFVVFHTWRGDLVAGGRRPVEMPFGSLHTFASDRQRRALTVVVLVLDSWRLAIVDGTCRRDGEGLESMECQRVWTGVQAVGSLVAQLRLVPLVCCFFSWRARLLSGHRVCLQKFTRPLGASICFACWSRRALIKRLSHERVRITVASLFKAAVALTFKLWAQILFIWRIQTTIAECLAASMERSVAFLAFRMWHAVKLREHRRSALISRTSFLIERRAALTPDWAPIVTFHLWARITTALRLQTTRINWFLRDIDRTIASRTFRAWHAARLRDQGVVQSSLVIQCLAAAMLQSALTLTFLLWVRTLHMLSAQTTRGMCLVGRVERTFMSRIFCRWHGVTGRKHTAAARNLFLVERLEAPICRLSVAFRFRLWARTTVDSRAQTAKVHQLVAIIDSAFVSRTFCAWHVGTLLGHGLAAQNSFTVESSEPSKPQSALAVFLGLCARTEVALRVQTTQVNNHLAIIGRRFVSRTLSEWHAVRLHGHALAARNLLLLQYFEASITRSVLTVTFRLWSQTALILRVQVTKVVCLLMITKRVLLTRTIGSWHALSLHRHASAAWNAFFVPRVEACIPRLALTKTFRLWVGATITPSWPTKQIVWRSGVRVTQALLSWRDWCSSRRALKISTTEAETFLRHCQDSLLRGSTLAAWRRNVMDQQHQRHHIRLSTWEVAMDRWDRCRRSGWALGLWVDFTNRCRCDRNHARELNDKQNALMRVSAVLSNNCAAVVIARILLAWRILTDGARAQTVLDEMAAKLRQEGVRRLGHIVLLLADSTLSAGLLNVYLRWACKAKFTRMLLPRLQRFNFEPFLVDWFLLWRAATKVAHLFCVTTTCAQRAIFSASSILKLALIWEIYFRWSCRARSHHLTRGCSKYLSRHFVGTIGIVFRVWYARGRQGALLVVASGRLVALREVLASWCVAFDSFNMWKQQHQSACKLASSMPLRNCNDNLLASPILNSGAFLLRSTLHAWLACHWRRKCCKVGAHKNKSCSIIQRSIISLLVVRQGRLRLRIAIWAWQKGTLCQVQKRLRLPCDHERFASKHLVAAMCSRLNRFSLQSAFAQWFASMFPIGRSCRDFVDTRKRACAAQVVEGERWKSHTLFYGAVVGLETLLLRASLTIWRFWCEQMALDCESRQLQCEVDRLLRENSVLRDGRESDICRRKALLSASLIEEVAEGSNVC